jgi:hypothetical protein
MIALGSDNLGGGGTADYDFYPVAWWTCRITDFDMSPAEIAERNRYIRHCRLYLFSVLGAFVVDGTLLYWRAKEIKAGGEKETLNQVGGIE